MRNSLTKIDGTDEGEVLMKQWKGHIKKGTKSDVRCPHSANNISDSDCSDYIAFYKEVIQAVNNATEEQ